MGLTRIGLYPGGDMSLVQACDLHPAAYRYCESSDITNSYSGHTYRVLMSGAE